jgi:hypothetical protein
VDVDDGGCGFVVGHVESLVFLVLDLECGVVAKLDLKQRDGPKYILIADGQTDRKLLVQLDLPDENL